MRPNPNKAHPPPILNTQQESFYEDSLWNPDKQQSFYEDYTIHPDKQQPFCEHDTIHSDKQQPFYEDSSRHPDKQELFYEDSTVHPGENQLFCEIAAPQWDKTAECMKMKGNTQVKRTLQVRNRTELTAGSEIFADNPKNLSLHPLFSARKRSW